MTFLRHFNQTESSKSDRPHKQESIPSSEALKYSIIRIGFSRERSVFFVSLQVIKENVNIRVVKHS